MTNLPAPIQRVIDATNAGDSDAFVAAFAEDAYLEDWGKGFHGHDGIRSWDSTDNIGRKSHFEVMGVAQEGDDWVVTLVVTGGGFNGTSDLRFHIADGLIDRMVITP